MSCLTNIKLTNMENIIKHFEKYSSSVEETWKNRFTWKGMTGKTPKHTTSIRKFEEATKAFEKIDPAYTVAGLFSLVDKLSDEYVSWVKSLEKGYTKEEYLDMKNFFIGAIGEYFVTKLLTDVKCLMVSMDGASHFERFDFNYVSPTLSGKESDCGIDIYCVANDKPSVMQVKFWSPFKKGSDKVNPVVYQKLFTEGVDHEFISTSDENNIFFFWLGSEKTAQMNIIGNETHRGKHLVVIGRLAIAASIDNRNKIFWDNFYNSLK